MNSASSRGSSSNVSPLPGQFPGCVGHLLAHNNGNLYSVSGNGMSRYNGLVHNAQDKKDGDFNMGNQGNPYMDMAHLEHGAALEAGPNSKEGIANHMVVQQQQPIGGYNAVYKRGGMPPTSNMSYMGPFKQEQGMEDMYQDSGHLQAQLPPTSIQNSLPDARALEASMPPPPPYPENMSQNFDTSPGVASNQGDKELDDGELGQRYCKWIDCNQVFKEQDELVRHIEKQHIDQRKGEDFTCFWSGCPRRHKPFNARYKLLIHMRVHSGEKPNKCTVSWILMLPLSVKKKLLRIRGVSWFEHWLART